MATSDRTRGGLGAKLARPFVRLYQFLQGVWYELGRVVWPSKEETYTFTLVVIIVVAIVAAYMGLLDLILASFTTRVLGI